MSQQQEQLPEELNSLFKDARAVDPTGDELDSLRMALGSKMDTPMPSPQGMGGTSGAFRSKLALVSIGVVLLGGAGLWWVSSRTPAEVDRSGGAGHHARSQTPAAVHERPATEANLPEPEVVPPTSALSPPDPQPGEGAEGRHATDSRPNANSRPSESELLDRAQAALRRRPSKALRLTRTHARLYRDGNLAQEREALAIRALIALERSAGARRRLRAFEARWPQSAHLHGLREQVEELSAGSNRGQEESPPSP